MTSTSEGGWAALPDDILKLVAPLCEQTDLARLHCTCNKYHKALPAAVEPTLVDPTVCYHGMFRALYRNYIPDAYPSYNRSLFHVGQNFNVLRFTSGMSRYSSYYL